MALCGPLGLRMLIMEADVDVDVDVDESSGYSLCIGTPEQ